MPIITLITDWSSADYYIGALKGKILSQCPDATIVDLNHQIESYSVSMAAFVLKHSYDNFPKGTVHVVSVDSEPSKKKSIVAVKYDGHFFVSTDNGIFTLSFESEVKSVVEIKHDDIIGSFPELNVFAYAASYIASNQEISKLGELRESVFRLIPLKASAEESVITGQIIHIDSYGNAITNVTKEVFENVRGDRIFKIYVQSNRNIITEINTSYNQSSYGELLAIFNSINYLEIAIRGGNACQVFNLEKKNSSIRIVFEEKKAAAQGQLF